MKPIEIDMFYVMEHLEPEDAREIAKRFLGIEINAPLSFDDIETLQWITKDLGRFTRLRKEQIL